MEKLFTHSDTIELMYGLNNMCVCCIENEGRPIA